MASLTRSSCAELLMAPLTWDSRLASDAQQYANQLAAADSGLQHSQQIFQQGQGENLASFSGPWPNPYTQSSKLWYAEKQNWNGGAVQAQTTSIVGRYTQVSGCRSRHAAAQQIYSSWYL